MIKSEIDIEATLKQISAVSAAMTKQALEHCKDEEARQFIILQSNFQTAIVDLYRASATATNKGVDEKLFAKAIGIVLGNFLRAVTGVIPLAAQLQLVDILFSFIAGDGPEGKTLTATINSIKAKQ